MKEDRASIYLDDERIVLSIDDYYAYRLSENKEIDDELYETLKERENYFRSYNSCLRKLAVKDRTVKQIRDYLRGQKLDKEDIEDIIDRLTDYGLLDDVSYCINKTAYYDDQLLSNRKIIFKLKNEGIDEEIIRENVNNDYDREVEKATQTALKTINSVRNKSEKALKQHVLQKLSASGFPYDICRKALDSLDIDVENELELLSKEFDKSFRKYAKKYEGYELRSKIYGSLLLRGFNSDDIRRVMEDNHV